jgi:cell division protein FtsL
MYAFKLVTTVVPSRYSKRRQKERENALVRQKLHLCTVAKSLYADATSTFANVLVRYVSMYTVDLAAYHASLVEILTKETAKTTTIALHP